MEFWFDAADARSYLMSRDVGRLAAEAKCAVRWRPVRLPAPVLPVARSAVLAVDLERQARDAGVVLRRPTEVEPGQVDGVMGSLLAMPPEDVAAEAPGLLAALWDVDGGAVPDHAAPSAPVLAAAADAAQRAGVFGTPTVTHGEQVAFGADRLVFVRESLGLPAPVVSFPPAAPGGRWAWFHDVASPFSYLASTQIPRMVAQTGVAPDVVPILVGALFRAVGTPVVPISTFTEAHRAWAVTDLTAWARRWGVPFRFPSTFPLRSVVAQRILLLDGRGTDPLYRAAWVEDRDIGDPEVLVDVLDSAGLDGSGLVAAAGAPEVKDRLRANTDRAHRAGMCGVPSFTVGDSRPYWGQDRLEQVARDLAAGALQSDGSLSSTMEAP